MTPIFWCQIFELGQKRRGSSPPSLLFTVVDPCQLIAHMPPTTVCLLRPSHTASALHCHRRMRPHATKSKLLLLASAPPPPYIATAVCSRKLPRPTRSCRRGRWHRLLGHGQNDWPKQVILFYFTFFILICGVLLSNVHGMNHNDCIIRYEKNSKC